MDFSEYKLNEADMVALGQIPDSAPAIAILKVVKVMYEKEVRKLVDGTVGKCDEDPRRDFRHSIGVASAAVKILELHKEALKQTEES